jgi:hypothetical protein
VVRPTICGECISSIAAALISRLPFQVPSPSWKRSQMARSRGVETMPDAGATVVNLKWRIGWCTPARMACGEAAFGTARFSSALLSLMPRGRRRRSVTSALQLFPVTASAIAPETETITFE